jgi:hypothetical protein
MLSFQFTSPSTVGNIPIPEDQKKFMEIILDRVESWVQAGSDGEPVLYLERCNPFQRKLIYQTLKSKYAQELFLETVDKEKDKVIAVSKVIFNLILVSFSYFLWGPLSFNNANFLTYSEYHIRTLVI